MSIEMITPNEAMHLTAAAYKNKPQTLERYIRSKLPGWECLGIETFYDRQVVVFQKIGSDYVVTSMAGNTPLKWRNICKSEFRSTWSQSVCNEFFGSDKNYRKFFSEMTKRYGRIDLWCGHSAAGFEIINLNPEGTIFLINPHPPHGKYNDNTYPARTRDDWLTEHRKIGSFEMDLDRCNDQMADLGPGGHGVKEGKQVLETSDWDQIFPDRFQPVIAKDTPNGPKVLFPRNEYPSPAFQNKEKLWKDVYKKLKTELYEEFRAKRLEEILKKTSNSKKIGKKIEQVFDDIKNHPVNHSVKDALKNKAYKAVPVASEYIDGCVEIDQKAAIDRQIEAGDLELVDHLPELPKEIGILDNVVSTGVSYALHTGIITFSVSTLVRIHAISGQWAHLTKKQRWEETKNLIGHVVIDTTKASLETGIVASVGQLASNGLQLLGYGLKNVVPITLQAWYTSKEIWAYASAPVVRAVQIDLRPYLPYMKPKKPLSLTEIDGITGKVLREHARRISNGEMDPKNEEEDIYLLTKESMNRLNK
ncbi:MAG: hypothetical protein K940chlam9_00667 [Chlamydiae bacterium]|nr:hypothetical protein [Chlamydiota bacterium]